MAAKKMKKSSTAPAPAPAPPPSLEEQRKKFVAEKVAQGVSREAAKQQFYVQTRVKELKAAGKEVTPAVRAQLRQNWQTGKVKRAAFGAPKKATTTTTSTSTKAATPSTTRMGPETTSYTTKKPDRMGQEPMVGMMSPATGKVARTAAPTPATKGTSKMDWIKSYLGSQKDQFPNRLVAASPVAALALPIIKSARNQGVNPTNVTSFTPRELAGKAGSFVADTARTNALTGASLLVRQSPVPFAAVTAYQMQKAGAFGNTTKPAKRTSGGGGRSGTKR